MPRRRSASKKKTKSAKKRKPRRRKLRRRHKTDKHSHTTRRHHKHPGHQRRILSEVETVNTLLTQLLQTASSTESNPYHYDKRHYTKDPEYRWETQERQEFKKGFPAPDVSMLRPQADDLPPHWGNYPIPAVAHRR